MTRFVRDVTASTTTGRMAPSGRHPSVVSANVTVSSDCAAAPFGAQPTPLAASPTVRPPTALAFTGTTTYAQNKAMSGPATTSSRASVSIACGELSAIRRPRNAVA